MNKGKMMTKSTNNSENNTAILALLPQMLINVNVLVK